MNTGMSEKFWNYVEWCMELILIKGLRISFSKSAWKGLVQFVKFGIVGVSNTLLGFIIYAVSLWEMRNIGVCGGYDCYVAQLIMFFLSVLWSFYWNNKAVFMRDVDEHRKILPALLKTYISYAFTSLFLSEFLLVLWIEICGLNEYLGPLLCLLITVPLNYIIQKYWAFAK